MVMGWDGYACLLLTTMAVFLARGGTKAVVNMTYADYVEEHTAAEGEVGGIAGDDVFRAESVADLLENDTFTVVTPGTQYTEGNAYYEFSSGLRVNMKGLELPSGERVAAYINHENVQQQGETFEDTVSILPVGCIVYEDLSQDPTFLEHIQSFSRPLDYTDFYVDMRGNSAKMSQEQYAEGPIAVATLVSAVIAFPLFHALGARIGLWAYYFPHKKKENQKTG